MTLRALRRTLLVLVVVVLAYVAWIAYQVWDSSHRDEVHSADAIIVLGAAQYNGVPSPVFRARLDQAAYLYENGVSQIVIVTGGKQSGDRFTESEAGAQYLAEEGVEATSILQENEGGTTWESMKGAARLARSRDVSAVLLVSDPLHSERLERMAHDLGFADVFTSPASYVELNRSRATKLKELVHEVGSIISYEILGH